MGSWDNILLHGGLLGSVTVKHFKTPLDDWSIKCETQREKGDCLLDEAVSPSLILSVTFSVFTVSVSVGT